MLIKEKIKFTFVSTSKTSLGTELELGSSCPQAEPNCYCG